MSERKIRDLLVRWIAAGRRTVHEADAKRVLALAGIPVPGRPRGAGPRVVKLASDRYPHKSEHGLVHVGVAPAEVPALARRLQRKDPDGTVLVERMIRGGVAEWIVGCKSDATFGPVALAGPGGVLVELLDAVEVRLAPVGLRTARRLVKEGPGAALLEGVRGSPPADREALARLIVDLSRFYVRFRDLVAEIELNPAIVMPRGRGVVAADALLVLCRAGDARAGSSAKRAP